MTDLRFKFMGTPKWELYWLSKLVPNYGKVVAHMDDEHEAHTLADRMNQSSFGIIEYHVREIRVDGN